MPQETAEQIKKEASNLYKSKNYKAALDLYCKLYSEFRNDCNDWDARYYAWCIYYLEIKNKKDEDIVKDENSFFKAVNAIIELAKDNGDMAYITTVFRVLSYFDSKAIFPAKEIIFWTDKLDSSRLGTDCFGYVDSSGKNRENPSNKEKYFALRTKAFEELKKFKECIKLSEEALSVLDKFHYDNDVWFKRRVALSKGHLGETEQAITELVQILSRKKEWFIQKNIAELLLEVKKLDEAFGYAMDAALNYGELKFKCELFVLMGRILNAQQKSEEAKKYFLLSYKLRNENQWKIPQELQGEINKLVINNTATSQQIYQELKKDWQLKKEADSPRLNGVIKNILPNGLVGFIVGDDKKDYFFSLKDYRGGKNEIISGLPVKFSAERVFDKKKNRESEKAVDIIKN